MSIFIPSRNIMRLLSCAVATGAMLGCSDGGSPAAPSSPVNATFSLAPAQSVELGDTGNVLTFQRVTEDSRCPAAANCIQAGQAVIALGLLIGGDAIQPFSLATAADRKSVLVEQFEFTLDELAPYPERSPVRIPETAYRAQIRVVQH